MSKLAKVLQAAAGNAGGAGELAAAIDFDGTDDYLLRSGGLTGSADGKTFTFSAWVYISQYNSYNTILQGNGQAFNFSFNSSGNFYIKCLNSNNSSYVLDVRVPAYQTTQDTFVHILASVNMTSQSLTRIYFNDVLQTLQYDSAFGTNSDLDFTASSVAVGALTTGANKFKGRISNLYLDYTYRNLDVVANRRLFITEDLKPADGQAGLSPILYMPLNDPEDIGYNAGTGGNFTVNGVMDRSGRGPNQDNCVASSLDGSNDYLTTGFISGISDGKQFTFSASFNCNTVGAYNLFDISNGISGYFRITIYPSGGKMKMEMFGGNTSLSTIFYANTANVMVAGRQYTFTASIDLSDTAKRHVYLNGESLATTWNTYSNQNIDFTRTASAIGGYSYTDYNKLNGKLGEVYFDNTYTDLSADNPFWDADNSRAKPVRQVLEETNNTPLIAMPIEGSNAGLNLGTSQNYTVNSGPYIGARGASEAITRSVEIQGSRGDEQNKLYLQVGSSGGLGGTKLTVVHFFKSNTDEETGHLWISPYSGSYYTGFLKSNVGNGGSQRWTLGLYNWFINGDTYGTFPFSTNWNVVMFSVDSQDASKGRLYFQQGNNTKLVSSFPAPTSLGDLNRWAVFQDKGSANTGLVYATDDYIDFGQESNRLLFVDALGYPTDIVKNNEDGLIPPAKILLPFDDSTNFGKNVGTLGDFTTVGTPTSGKDFVRP